MLDVDVDVDVEKLTYLIEQWNAGCQQARNDLVIYLQPFITKFSALEFSKGKVVATPLKLFGVNDIAQTVSIKLLTKQNNIYFHSINDLFILLRKMVYSTLVDEARKLSRHGADNRVQIGACPNAYLSDSNSLNSEHSFLMLDEAISVLESKAKQQSIAFSLYRLWGVDVQKITVILGISESTFYRYLEFADAVIKSHLLSSKNG